MRRSVLVVAVGLCVTLLVAPASTYSTAGLARGAGIGVADDPDAVIGLQTPTTDGDKSGELVTLTNQFDERRTFTVRLRNKTNEYDLTVGARRGDAVTVTLEPGDSIPVGYEQTANGPPAGDVAFAVETTGGVSASLVRSRSIKEAGPDGGGPPCGPGPNGPPADSPACSDLAAPEVV